MTDEQEIRRRAAVAVADICQRAEAGGSLTEIEAMVYVTAVLRERLEPGAAGVMLASEDLAVFVDVCETLMCLAAAAVAEAEDDALAESEPAPAPGVPRVH